MSIRSFTASILLAILFVSHSAFAQDNSAYIVKMKSEIANLYTLDSLSKLSGSVLSFEKIAKENPKEWLPVYYQALALSRAGGNTQISEERRDAALDRGIDLLIQADKLSPKNSEIAALQAILQMGKLMIDPQSRGAELVGTIQDYASQALIINKDNPRALSISAMIEYGIAQYMQSGIDEACKQAVAAKNAYDVEAKIKDTINPTWGKELIIQVLEGCK